MVKHEVVKHEDVNYLANKTVEQSMQRKATAQENSPAMLQEKRRLLLPSSSRAIRPALNYACNLWPHGPRPDIWRRCGDRAHKLHLDCIWYSRPY